MKRNPSEMDGVGGDAGCGEASSFEPHAVKRAGRQSRPARGGIPFELPRGFRDSKGNRYRRGWMWPALVRDEVEALEDFRVFLNPDLILPVLLSKVLAFDPRGRVNPSFLESFPAADLRFLERLYRELNGYPVNQNSDKKGGLEGTGGSTRGHPRDLKDV